MKDQVLSCKLTTPELRQRKATVLAALKGEILARKELANGYSYTLPYKDENLSLVTTFIQTERLCCDFFDFEVKVLSSNEILLALSGPEGTKGFINEELEL